MKSFLDTKPGALIPLLALILFLWTSCASMPASAPTPQVASFRIVAYATDATVPEIIPYEQLTHINYSFLIPNDDGTFAHLSNSWKLKKIVEDGHAKGVKVCIAVGGWGWDAEFESMAASAESRGAFVQNLKSFVDEYQLDGVDMDWEYPDPGESAQNYLALMKELRAALPDKLISTAVISYGDEFGLGIPNETFTLIDFVNVMTYDSPDHGSMEQFNKGLRYWTERGISENKINIGVPFYSRPGEVPYAKIVLNDPASAQVDSCEFNGATQIYNGIPTIQEKTELAMQKAGGIMFWELRHDAQGELSLVNAIYETAHGQ